MSFIPIGDRQEEVLQKAICLILSIYHLFFFSFFFYTRSWAYVCKVERVEVSTVCVVYDVSDPPWDFSPQAE